MDNHQLSGGAEGVRGGPRPAAITATAFVFSIERGDMPALQNSAEHGPRPMLNGILFNQLLGSMDKHMKEALILATIGVALMHASCNSVGQRLGEPDVKQRQADAESLLAKVRAVLPEGWEARLYWNPKDLEVEAPRYSVNWMDKKWREWLPGTDGRRIEISRKEIVRFLVDASGPNPIASYKRKEEEYLRFALTLGNLRHAEDINYRLAELNDRITRLEVVLKSSFSRREKDGFVQHSLPQDDEGRRAFQEYDRLWAIKRWFPQWSEGSASVGFRSLVRLRILPEEAQAEYRQVKKTVLNVLLPVPDLGYIPSYEE